MTWDKDWDDVEDEADEPQPSGEWAALMEKYSIGQGG